jgi:hypothetical protein
MAVCRPSELDQLRRHNARLIALFEATAQEDCDASPRA